TRGPVSVRSATGKFPNCLPGRKPRMKQKPRTIRAALAAAATVAAAIGLGATGAASAAATALPAHVFAPYFEAYNGDNPVTLSQQPGAKSLPSAFIQPAPAGSCTAYGKGDPSQPIAASTFGSDISSIQAAGGNVTPSFGGYTADTTGTDIA